MADGGAPPQAARLLQQRCFTCNAPPALGSGRWCCRAMRLGAPSGEAALRRGAAAHIAAEVQPLERSAVHLPYDPEAPA